MGRGSFDSGHGHVHHLIRAFAQLVLHVNGRGGQKGVYARASGVTDGLPGAIDVGLHAPGQPGDFGLSDQSGDGLHGLEVALAGGRKARFDAVHAQHFQLAGQAQFFLKVHGRAGALFAVAQRRVEDKNAVAHAGLRIGLRMLCKNGTKPAERGLVPSTMRTLGAFQLWVRWRSIWRLRRGSSRKV